MSATNYTPIYLYNSGTATNTPSAANLGAGELAINYADGKLFYKDGSAAVQVIGWKTTPTTAGGTGLTSYTAGDLPYYASGSALSKLAIGTSGYVLQSNGSAPTWVAQSTLTVGTATNATNTAITDNTSSSATWYPTIVSATTGNLPQTTSSTKLSFVPSTGILTATGFSGAFNGTVGATTPNTGAFTTLSNTGETFNPGSSDATTYVQATLKGGTASGNGIGYMQRQTTGSVSNSATTIYNPANFGHLAIVSGVGGGAIFADLLMVGYAAVTVIASTTGQGSPASRTYTCSAGALKLTMGSSTAMAIIVQTLSTGGTGS